MSKKYPFVEAVTPRLLNVGDHLVVGRPVGKPSGALHRCGWGGQVLRDVQGVELGLESGEYRVDEIVYTVEERPASGRSYYILRLGLVDSEVSRLVRIAPSGTVRRITGSHLAFVDDPGDRRRVDARTLSEDLVRDITDWAVVRERLRLVVEGANDDGTDDQDDWDNYDHWREDAEYLVDAVLVELDEARVDAAERLPTRC